jgi:hypothetical protein
MQVWFLSGLANNIKGDIEAMVQDLSQARALFEKYQCEEHDILADIDAMLAQVPQHVQAQIHEQAAAEQPSGSHLSMQL